MTPSPSSPGSFASRVEATQVTRVNVILRLLDRYELSPGQREAARAIATQVVLGQYAPPTSWAEIQDRTADLAHDYRLSRVDAFGLMMWLDAAGIIPRLADGLLTASDAQLGEYLGGKAVGND